jgi:DNA-binding helix-hairpin-helix protein with protein kinase domain
MHQILKVSQTVTGVLSGASYRVGSYLGGGGQGEVYAARADGRDLALKWYFPASASEAQRKALMELSQQAPPDERFLWPQEVTTAEGVTGFGYVMPLREERFKSLFDLMKRRIDPTFRALLTAGMGLADSYWKLHARGLCYCDISFGNAFFDDRTGDVQICDNDNVAVDKTGAGRVPGTPRFMAPEVVLGKPPSSDSDRFSLAVLLFYMLHIHHPLEGVKEQAIKCLDLPAQRKLFGEEPVFIFDPADTSNRPDRSTQENAWTYWEIYPQSLRDHFVRSFTSGLRDPENGRVRETEWRDELARVRDAILYCSHCKAENFHDPRAVDAGGRFHKRCWKCRKDLRLPLHLVYEQGEIVMLNHDTKLYPHHLANRPFDFSAPCAEVARHPADPASLGLRNLSSTPWFFTPREGAETLEVPPGKAALLLAGARVNFGPVRGVFQAQAQP